LLSLRITLYKFHDDFEVDYAKLLEILRSHYYAEPF
jgi:hypothetical protein